VGPLPGAGRPPPGAFPPQAVRRDRLWVGLERLGAKVASGSGRELYSALRPDLAASRGPWNIVLAAPSLPLSPSPPHLSGEGGAGGRREGRGPPLPARLSTGADCPQCAPTASRRQGGDRPTSRRQGSAAMSATHPTRLETRTKESNARASQRVEQTPWRNESEGRRAPAEVGSRPRGARAHHRPVSPAPSGRWSVSACDRTRKMVNYAWAGRSQRKLWWRPVAVLTCKSVVRPGYRGERLIEPSSSWFPPKFPSG